MKPKFNAPLPFPKRSVFSAVTLLVFLLLAWAAPVRALTIIPVWGSTITNDANAAIIESTINMAIQFYEARFADPINVTIQFQEMSDGLGESEWEYYSIPYSQFLSALQSDATTTNDAVAVAQLELLAHLAPGPNNPVTGNTNIFVHSANLRALGLSGFAPPSPEGTVYLNTSLMNLSRTNINPSKYDLLSVAEHEMDEVLGFGSELPNSEDPFPQDLFRYTSAGALTFTTNGDDAYFSIDGTNLLVQFNQQLGGDFGDWWSCCGAHPLHVQDAYATAGTTPNPTVELIGLDVQGFDLVPPPQPRIVSINLSGNNLVLNGTNGLSTGVYHLLTSTNLMLPLKEWSSIATNALTANGAFSMTATNVLKGKTGGEFYVLQLQ